jgi:peptidoglycan/LPS O-acetylase OafA/YrhL
MNQTYIPTLNGWRAVAVLMVICTHSVTALRNTGTNSGALLAIANVFEHAGVGVDLFFAISGYLICTLLLNEKDKIGFISLRSFYIRRAFRILPAVAVYLLILVTLKYFNLLPSLTTGEVVASGLFFRNYITGSWYTLHFWSLAVEEHFYIFVPMMLSVLSWRSALKVAITIAVASCLARYMESGTPGPALYFNTECRIDAIMYGAILALLLSRDDFRLWLTKNLTLISLVAIFAVLSVLIFYFHGVATRRTIIALAMPEVDPGNRTRC